MDLTPEEKHRIYLEEKARLEAQEQLRREARQREVEQQASRERERASHRRVGYTVMGALLIVAYVIYASWPAEKPQPTALSPSPTKTAAPAPPPKPRCNVAGADQMIQKLQQMGVIYKIDTSTDLPKIYVGDAWPGLAIDEKQTFDGVLQCSLSRGTKSRLLIYKDPRTGKDIARSSQYGFEMY